MEEPEADGGRKASMQKKTSGSLQDRKGRLPGHSVEGRSNVTSLERPRESPTVFTQGTAQDEPVHFAGMELRGLQTEFVRNTSFRTGGPSKKREPHHFL